MVMRSSTARYNLPKEWSDDPDRLEGAYVPPDVGFATKPTLATTMIAASVPFKWIAGDTEHGCSTKQRYVHDHTVVWSLWNTGAMPACTLPNIVTRPNHAIYFR